MQKNCRTLQTKKRIRRRVLHQRFDLDHKMLLSGSGFADGNTSNPSHSGGGGEPVMSIAVTVKNVLFILNDRVRPGVRRSERGERRLEADAVRPRDDAELARAGEVFVPLDNLEGHRLDTMMLWFEVRNSVTAI
jgi:hypothetical protein